MQVLCKLTDKEILGKSGQSTKEPRLAARAIVRKNDGLYAVMYSEKFNLYSLPGGGLEENEDVLTALYREILEETGCICDIIEEIGIVEENRFCYDFTQINYYFFVTTQKQEKLHLTEKETEAGTSVQWHSLENVMHLISEAVHDTPQRKYIQARDMVAIHTFISTKKEDD